MAFHNTLGEKGEQCATEFLLGKEYKILERQWRFQHKEIDIIAEKDNVLIFVEVKTRTSEYWGNPEEFVDRKKQRLLIAAAEQYICENNFDGESRFDIISIVFNQQEINIEHITEAFYP
jgi:putative endonuclease